MLILCCMADVAASPPFPRFSIGDRMEKARLACGIKNTKRMAELLGPLLGKPVAPSTVSAWESERNQPTRGGIRMEHVVIAWAQACNEEATRLGLAVTVTPEWLYTGTESRKTRSDKSRNRRSTHLTGLPRNPKPTRSKNLGSPLAMPV